MNKKQDLGKMAFWDKDYFPKTSYKMKCQFYIMCLLWAFQGPIINSIPFLFYHPKMECQISGQWTFCTEDQMCENNYQFRYQEYHYIQSISQEFNFLCNGRLTESAILSLAMGGQIIGFILCMLYDFPKRIKARMILYTIIAEVITLFFVNDSEMNVITISVVMFAWNFFFAFYFGQQYSYICDVYSDDINLQAPVILGLIMPLFGIVYLGFAYVSSEWRSHLIKFTAIPLLVLVVIWYSMYDYRDDETVDQSEEKSSVSRVENSDLITNFLVKLKDLVSSERYLINGIVYILCWVGSSCGYTTTLIVFNAIDPSAFFHNLLVSTVFECLSALIAYFLAICRHTNKRVKSMMQYVTIITAFVQISSSFLPYSSTSTHLNYLVVMTPILVSKVYNKIIIVCLLLDMYTCVPFKFLLILFVTSNILSLVFCSVMPLFNLFMNSIDVSAFFVHGVVTLVSAIFISKMTYMSDQEVQQSAIDAASIDQVPPQIHIAQTRLKRSQHRNSTHLNDNPSSENEQTLIELRQI